MNLTLEKLREGKLAQALERQTSRIPADFFLFGALGAMGVSLGLALAKQPKAAAIVSQWVPAALLFGVYAKIVNVAGRDAADRRIH